MTALLSACRRLLRLVGHIERWIGVSLLIGIVLAITTQVFTRYALNRPIIWVEEFSVYAFIWGTFLGASIGLKYGRHVKIETYVSHLPARGQAAARLLVNLIIFFVLWLLVQEVGKVIAIEGRSTSVSLPWPIPRAWFYSIPIMVSCLSMMATCAYLMLAEFDALAGRAPGDGPQSIMDHSTVPTLPH
jgi:TRAP-type C4-dicarboxylate transport system permease small subunit